MSGRLPEHVDPWRAAASGAVLSGALRPSRLPRLGAVAEVVAPVEVELEFSAPRPDRVRMKLVVVATLVQTCQRCLQEFARDERVEGELWIANGDEAAPALEENGEVVVCAPGSRLSLASMVEDELLLALPLAPAHAPGVCHQLEVNDSASEASGDASAGAMNNPFAVLAGLKRDRDDDDEH